MDKSADDNDVSLRAMNLDHAMIFAAGRGTRMRELVNNCPKPFLKINGKTIIERLIERLLKNNITNILVNVHYQADVAIRELQEIQERHSNLKLTISKEDDLLETGGGAKFAIQNHPDFFQSGVFWAFNGDMLWHDTPNSNLIQEMAKAWDADKMDLLLSLFPKEKVDNHGDKGDYHILDDGQLKRTSDTTAPLLFAGARICTTTLVTSFDEKAFSYLKLFDLSETKNRLYGHIQKGAWYHIGTPESLQTTDKLFKSVEVGATVLNLKAL